MYLAHYSFMVAGYTYTPLRPQMKGLPATFEVSSDGDVPVAAAIFEALS